MWGDDIGWHFHCKNCFVLLKCTYVCVKIVFLFILLITHKCGAPASWADNSGEFSADSWWAHLKCKNFAIITISWPPSLILHLFSCWSIAYDCNGHVDIASVVFEYINNCIIMGRFLLTVVVYCTVFNSITDECKCHYLSNIKMLIVWKKI